MSSVLCIFIQGFKDGEYNVDESCYAQDIAEIAEEFIGKVRVRGTLRKLMQRFILEAEIEATAQLVCDVSLEEFEEKVTVPLRATYHIGASDTVADEHNNVFVISDESKYIELDNVVREELVLGLPLKRIAPYWREHEWQPPINDITITDEDAPSADGRWAVLKNMLNNSQN